MGGDREPFFPYFCIFGGMLTLIVCAYAPDGDAQRSAVQVGSGLAGGGLSAYGLHLKSKRDE